MAISVLLVDDEQDFLDIFSAWLVFKGFKVSVAHDGRDALDKLTADGFDLVLLDLMMPRLDGYEFCKQVRKTDRVRDIPIVVLTAVQRLTGCARALNAGADAYLEKVAPHEEMELTIRKVMSEKGVSLDEASESLY